MEGVVLPRTIPWGAQKRKPRNALGRAGPLDFLLGPAYCRMGKLTMKEEAKMKDYRAM